MRDSLILRFVSENMKIFNRYPSDIFEKFVLKSKLSFRKATQITQFYFHFLESYSKRKKTLKLLCVFDRSCNIHYLSQMLAYQKAWGLIHYKVVDLQKYLEEDEKDYDLLIYQTWSSEMDYAPLADQKFRVSKLPKILFDAHASGSFDTYYRFNAPEIPRIKNAPHLQFLKDFNVIAKTSHPIEILKDKEKIRDVDISYCVGLQTHKVRPQIYEKVMPYQSRCRVDLKNNQHNYVSYLRRVRISINAPGYGEGTFRHLYTLNAKALLFAHDSILPIQILPFKELIPNQDYIVFNLENFDEKLEWALSHPKEIKEIAQCGYETFISGYDIVRSAKELYPKFIEISKKI